MRAGTERIRKEGERDSVEEEEGDQEKISATRINRREDSSKEYGEIR